MLARSRGSYLSAAPRAPEGSARWRAKDGVSVLSTPLELSPTVLGAVVLSGDWSREYPFSHICKSRWSSEDILLSVSFVEAFVLSSTISPKAET